MTSHFNSKQINLNFPINSDILQGPLSGRPYLKAEWPKVRIQK